MLSRPVSGHLSTVDGGLRVIFKLKNEQRIGRPSQDRALKVEMSPHPSFQVSVEGTRGKYSDLVFHTEEETWLLCESQRSVRGPCRSREGDGLAAAMLI